MKHSWKILGMTLMYIIGVMCAYTSPSFAYQVTLEWYQGFDVDTGRKEFDPTVLMIIVGDTQSAQNFLGLPEATTMPEFKPNVDAHFELGSLMLASALEFAVLRETPQDEVNAELLDTLLLENAVMPQIMLNQNDTLVVLTKDAYYKIWNVESFGQWGNSFEYEKFADVLKQAVPEPGTLVLFGLGLIGLIRFFRKQRARGGKRNSGKWLIIFMTALLLNPFAAARVNAQNSPWSVQYWNGKDLTVTAAYTETVDSFNYNWGTEPPGGMCPQQSCQRQCDQFGPISWNCRDVCSTYYISCWGINADNFSVRGTQQIMTEADAYTFIVKADDGVSVKVDGQEIITGDDNAPLRTLWETVSLSSGQHTLQVEYHDATGAAQVSLNFGKAADFRVLSLNKLTPGDGTISGDGLNCGSDCAEIYPKGATVNVAVTPDAFSTFAGWEGACNGDGSCEVTMDVDKTVTAKFNALWKAEYLNSAGVVKHAQGETPLSIDYDWGGGYPGDTCQHCYRKCKRYVVFKKCWTECDPYSCWRMPADNFTVRWTRTVDFTPGEYVFYARVDADNGIRAWVDDQEVINGSAYDFGEKITLNGFHTVKVEYHEGTGSAKVHFRWGSPEEFATLNVVNTSNFGNGTVTADTTLNCGAGCETIYEKGESVTLTAMPDGASAFGGWGGACSGANASCALTMDGDQTVFARFDAQWNAAYFPTADQSGTPAHVQNEAAINQNWGVKQPGGICSTCVRYVKLFGRQFCVQYASAPCWGLNADNFSVKWEKRSNFSAEPYTFITNADDQVSVSIDGREIMNSGDAVHSAQSQWKTIMMTEGAHDIRVVYHDVSGAAQAAFTFGKAEDFKVLTVRNQSNLGTGTVTANGIDCGADCQEIYAKGTSVPVTAAPNAGAVLGTWEGACTGDGACTVTMDTDKTLTANFDPLWKAEYFATADCSGIPLKTQTEAKINYVAGATWPGAGIQCVRWTRSSSFDDGFYTFVATSPKPLNVMLDNAEIVNGQSEHEGNVYWNAITLTAGKHDVQVTYAPQAPAAGPLGNDHPSSPNTVSFYHLRGKPATIVSATGPACVKVGQQLVSEMFTLRWMPETPAQQELVIEPSVAPAPAVSQFVPVAMPKALPFNLLKLLDNKLPIGLLDATATATSPNRGTVPVKAPDNAIVQLPGYDNRIIVVDESKQYPKDGLELLKIPGTDVVPITKNFLMSLGPLGCRAERCTITPPGISDIVVKASVSPLCCPDAAPFVVMPSVQVTGSGSLNLGSVDCYIQLYGIPYIIELGAYLEAGGNIGYNIDGKTYCNSARICGNVNAAVYVGGGLDGKILTIPCIEKSVAEVRVGLRAELSANGGSLCYHTNRGLCFAIPRTCAALKARGQVKLLFGLIKKSIDKTVAKTCVRTPKVGQCF